MIFVVVVFGGVLINFVMSFTVLQSSNEASMTLFFLQILVSMILLRDDQSMSLKSTLAMLSPLAMNFQFLDFDMKGLSYDEWRLHEEIGFEPSFSNLKWISYYSGSFVMNNLRLLVIGSLIFAGLMLGTLAEWHYRKQTNKKAIFVVSLPLRLLFGVSYFFIISAFLELH